MVILANINSKTYHIDVGFANFGTLSPLPLEDGAMVNCVPGLEARLVRRSIPDNVTDQKLWVLETRDSHSNVWKNGYCFGETEFLPQDFASLNFRTMRDPSSWFTTTFILTKVLLAEETDDSKDKVAVGTLTMFGDTLQRRLDGGDSEVILVCKSEAERVAALEKWFGIALSTEEKEAIKGFASEIKEQTA
jgi:arylamine N-acetyltransferase